MGIEDSYMVKKKVDNDEKSTNNRLLFLKKNGKYYLGYKKSLISLREVTCKIVLISTNCLSIHTSELIYYAMMLRARATTENLIDMYKLGFVFGKEYTISTLTIIDK